MIENKTELSQEQLDALVELRERIYQAVVEVWKAIKDAVINAAKELYENFIKPLIRHCFLLQLLEWKVPFWLARILQKITPWYGVHKIGLKYWQKRFA